MVHDLYPSVEAMLAPEVLSELEGLPITDVRCLPFQPTGNSASGSRFLRVGTNGGLGPRYVLKFSSPEIDWIVRTTGDRRCRLAATWQEGLLDRLPPQIEHGVVACAADGSGRAILMHDVSATLFPEGKPFSLMENQRLLDTMAALHAAFWESAELENPALGLCNPWHRYTFLGPQAMRREADAHEVPRAFLEGWELLEDMVESDVSSIICGLLDDPQPLCDALLRYPQTLVHGDTRQTNLGLQHDERSHTIVLDWHLVGRAPPAVDLAWYLDANWWILPVSPETAATYYHDCLVRQLGVRFDEGWWRPQFELSLLGQFVQFGCGHALGVAGHREVEAPLSGWRAKLSWWSNQVRAGAKWL